MIPVETELKIALAPAAHAVLEARLRALLGPPAELDQENRFFDAADHRLRQARRSVRLRREAERVVLTCKAKGSVDADGCHRHDEWEVEVPASVWPGPPEPAAMPGPWRDILAGAPLQALGGFANRRLEWHDGPHLLCLDRTDFAGRVDHELEIETALPGPALARWRPLLLGWGVPWTPQPVTKLQRWFEYRAT